MKNSASDLNIMLTDLIKAHEERLDDLSKKNNLNKKVFEAKQKRTNELRKKMGISPAELQTIGEADNKALKSYLENIRPGLINRKNSQPDDAKNKALYMELLSKTNYIMTTPVATLVTAPDNQHLKHIQGKLGNGWILPSDPSNIRVAVGDFGSGDGCHGASAQATGTTVTATLLFQFVPQATGLWNLTPVIAFHGFYVLKSDDTWLTCKSASINMDVFVSAFQYATIGPKHFKLMDKIDDNIDEFSLYDSTEFFDFLAPLRSGDEVTIRVTVSIDANAHGDGSYAELNFNNGDGNFISPIVLIAAPI